MQVGFARSDALRLATQVAGIVKPRLTIPVLTNLLLEAEGETLTITATDLDLWARATIPAKVKRHGAVTVNALDLTTILRGASDGEVALETAGRLKVTTASGRYQLPTIEADAFPSFPDGGLPEPVTLDADDLARLLDRVSFAAGADEAGQRPYLCGVLLEPRDATLRAVASDAGYLALAEIEADLSGLPRIILPNATVAVATRALRDADVCQVVWSKSAFRLDANGLTIQSKLLAYDYPEYERVLPRDVCRPCAVDAAALRAALARVVPFPDEKEVPVVFGMSPGGGTIRARVVSTSIEAEETFPLIYEGDDRQPIFSGRRLSRICRHFDGPEVHLGQDDRLKSMLVTDPVDPSYRFVIMPLRGSE